MRPTPSDHLGDLAAQGLGLAPERRDRTLHAQHSLDVFPKLQRAFDLLAQVAHAGLDPVHLLTGTHQPLGLPLRLREARAQRLEVLDLRSTAVQRSRSVSSSADTFHDRRQLTQLLRRGFRAANQSLQSGGDVRPILIDGDYGVVVAAAAFQERDHGSLQ